MMLSCNGQPRRAKACRWGIGNRNRRGRCSSRSAICRPRRGIRFMKSLTKRCVRRDTGQSYQDYLEQLAKNAGIENPTRSDLAKLDKNRKGKGSNEQWEHPHDKDARITKMKDGRTHLAHKAEHVVDLETGALLGVSLHEASQGDTETVVKSVEAAFAQVSVAIESTGAPLPERLFEEVVTDKGYHSNQSCQELQELGMRTYLSEPQRGRRRWEGNSEAQKSVYANRRRVKGERGKRLQRMRGERLERSNAHMYETGGMRRTHLRGHENILKRLIVHAAGFNLGLLMRQIGRASCRERV